MVTAWSFTLLLNTPQEYIHLRTFTYDFFADYDVDEIIREVQIKL